MKRDLNLKEQLAVAATYLKRTAPQDWDRFVTVMQNLAEAQAFKLVAATAETVYIEQGRARQIAELVKDLMDAPNVAGRILDGNK